MGGERLEPEQPQRLANTTRRFSAGSSGGFTRLAAPVPQVVLVYVQPDEPPDVPVGTLWFDTDEVRP